MLILKDFVSQAIEALKPFAEKYGARDQESERDVKAIRDALFPKSRTGEFARTLSPEYWLIRRLPSGHGSFELLLDVQGLYTMLG